MSTIPRAAGWEGKDWRAWYEALRTSLRSHLQALHSGSGEAAKHVHEARKHLKRLRTATRLLHGMLDREEEKHLRGLLRRAAHLLAGSRDSTVRLHTFDALFAESGTEDGVPLAAMRGKLLGEAADGEREAGLGAEEALALVDEAGLPAGGPAGEETSPVGKNLRGLAKRARRAYRRVMRGEEQDLHEFRKDVKDLYYGVEALPRGTGGGRKALLDSLKELEDDLGAYHDVEVLCEWAEARGCSREDYAVFWETAVEREEELRAKALVDAEVLQRLKKEPRLRKVLRRPEAVAATLQTAPVVP